MKVDCINFEKTGQFSRIFLDYINQKNSLNDFYTTFPSLENIEELSKNYTLVNRGALVQSLNKQYEEFSITKITSQNIDLLQKENTFTVTTGHQLNLATGPLFFVFKIITTINLAKELKAKYPNKDFVPIFWMASEDHDFEEINHFYLFGKKYEWNSVQKGAVGRFSTKGISEVLSQFPETIELINEAYSQPTLSKATRYLVNKLFGEQGLVILDADDVNLKTEFSSIVEKELFERKSEKAVLATSEKLEALDYKAQVHPREINLFYLTDDLRERILFEEGVFKVNNRTIAFSEEEIKEELKNHPERFSPNVILRPVYQQQILPNLAYIGGPGELAYWFQLKGVFELYNIPFPIIMPRNFGLLLDQNTQHKIEKVGLNEEDLFKSYNELKTAYLHEHSQIEPSISEEVEGIKTVFHKVIEKASSVDGSLQGAMEAEWQRLEKQFDSIEKRIKKAEERKHETALKQLESLKEKLFPHGGLQERHENIFSFLVNEPELLNTLTEKCNPLDFSMNVFNL